MIVVYLSAAAFLGAVISGIAGLGGGTLLIAVMLAVGLSPAVAVPVHAAVQSVSNGVRAAAYRQDLDWAAVGWFSLTCAPLPFLVAQLVVKVDVAVIELLLAMFIGLSLLPPRWNVLRAPMWSRRSKMLVAGAINGAIGVIVGATGIAIGPFFLDRNWSKETTVGTLAMCQTIGHGLKIAAFGAVGVEPIEHMSLLLPLMLAVAAGTVLGRWLMHHLPARQFTRLFKWILLLLAIRLGGGALLGLAGL